MQRLHCASHVVLIIFQAMDAAGTDGAIQRMTS
jgi:polyphosphate kinase 2 (PPK2 family)